MNAPPFLLGACLLFWGQQTRVLIPAVIMALILEGSRLVERRWELSRKHFHRVGDLSTVFFAALVVYLYLTRETLRAVTLILAWLPLATFPLIAAQELSTQGRLDLGALFWSLRRRAPELSAQTINISYPYLALCVLSAGAANVRTPVFYAGMFVLCAWALWKFRSPARPAWAWAAFMLAAGALGYAGQAGLMGTQLLLERTAENVVFGGGEVRMDPYQTRTAMGQIGMLQQSGGIALRVRVDGKPPTLLRTASYNHYANAQWFAREPGFRPIVPEADGSTWPLFPSSASDGSITVSVAWPKGEGVLALPLNAARLEGLAAGALNRNLLGAVKATDAPSAVSYRVDMAAGASRDSPPDALDLEVPPSEAGLFKDLAKELKLSSAKPGPSRDAASRFFSDNFRYTIFQEKASPEPLKDFIMTTRAGHCEYFATSTVLLLRAAGIPARYATGYSVQEYSRLEGQFVVRQRHAHAWTLAWIDGAWRDLDTTPMSWPEVEQGRASMLEPLSDLVSAARLRLSLWRWKVAGAGGGRGPAAWVLLAALAAWIVWKAHGLLGASRRSREEIVAAPVLSGADSEFYRIEAHLGRAGLGRRPREATAAWLDRIAPEIGPGRAARLALLLQLHLRYRFDPAGISEDERRALITGASDWLSAEPAVRL